jgi:hypothetical protein
MHLSTPLRLCVKFLDKHNMAAFTHPPHSPAVMPCDFQLFPKFNTALKGMRFHDITTNHEKSRDALVKIQCAAPNASFAEGAVWSPYEAQRGQHWVEDNEPNAARKLFAWFQASTTKKTRTALSWVIT